MTIKALETTWRGYRFRSRTEARWAVFFAHAAIPFEYERQGFALSSGPYLPDFWLPSKGAWLEVKGQQPTDRELSLVKELAAATDQRVFIAVGPPDSGTWGDTWVVHPDGGEFEERIEAPQSAYDAARAERFDGKPNPKPPTNSARGWW